MLSNEDQLEWIFAENPQLGPRERSEITTALETFWERSGTKTRFMRKPGESALRLLCDAAREALRDGGAVASDVDFLIYCGIGRGWLEPSTASVVVGELGLTRASGFDVLDACTGWIRALQLAQGLLATGEHRRGLIVSGEFNMIEFAGLRASNVDEIIERAAAFTVGEAATATLVETRGDDEAPFAFRFRTFGEHYDLSMIPLPGAHSWARDDFRFADARYRPLHFYSTASRQTATGIRRLVETVREPPAFESAGHDVAFGHAVSERAADVVCDALSIPRERLYRTHSGYGNTATSSVPLALSLAIRDGTLSRGKRCFIGVAGAGISIGVCSFRF